VLRSFSETVREVGGRNWLAISRHASFAYVVSMKDNGVMAPQAFVRSEWSSQPLIEPRRTRQKS
jgi:hypothetical protein